MHERYDIPHIHIHYDGDYKILEKLCSLEHIIVDLKESIMATQADLVAAFSVMKEKVTKIGTETQALLEKQQQLIDALREAGNLSPAVEAALADLQNQLQAVDDLVQDV